MDAADTSGELKRCPFCAGAGVSIQRKWLLGRQVHCDHCGHHGPTVRQIDYLWDGGKGDQDAAKAWNFRPVANPRERPGNWGG